MYMGWCANIWRTHLKKLASSHWMTAELQGNLQSEEDDDISETVGHRASGAIPKCSWGWAKKLLCLTLPSSTYSFVAISVWKGGRGHCSSNPHPFGPKNWDFASCQSRIDFSCIPDQFQLLLAKSSISTVCWSVEFVCLSVCLSVCLFVSNRTFLRITQKVFNVSISYFNTRMVW